MPQLLRRLQQGSALSPLQGKVPLSGAALQLLSSHQARRPCPQKAGKELLRVALRPSKALQIPQAAPEPPSLCSGMLQSKSGSVASLRLLHRPFRKPTLADSFSWPLQSRSGSAPSLKVQSHRLGHPNSANQRSLSLLNMSGSAASPGLRSPPLKHPSRVQGCPGGLRARCSKPPQRSAGSAANLALQSHPHTGKQPGSPGSLGSPH